jgi:hypothetical protein
MASAKANPISVARELTGTRWAIDHVWLRCEANATDLDRMVQTESKIMSFRLIAAVMISFVLASPAMAMHHRYDHRAGRELPVVDATHFGYGAGRCGYHSGYGGLYGDGYYPGNVCDDGGDHLID